MIGGAPVDQKYADHIGADIYASNAPAAASAALEILDAGRKSHIA